MDHNLTILSTPSPLEDLHNLVYQSVIGGNETKHAEEMIKETFDHFFKTRKFENYVNNLADYYPKANPSEVPVFTCEEKGPEDKYTGFSFAFSNDLTVKHHIKFNISSQTDEVTFETEKRVIKGQSVLTTTYRSDLIDPYNSTIGSLVLEALHVSGVVQTPSLDIMAYRDCFKAIPTIVNAAFSLVHCQEIYNGLIINYDNLHYGSIFRVHHPETQLDFLVSPIVLLSDSCEEYGIYVEVIQVSSKEELRAFIDKSYVEKMQIVCDRQVNDFPLKRIGHVRDVHDCSKDLTPTNRFSEEKTFKSFVNGFSKLAICDIYRHIGKKRFNNLIGVLDECTEAICLDKFGQEDGDSKD